MKNRSSQLLIGDGHQSVLGTVQAAGPFGIGYDPHGWRQPNVAMPVAGFKGQRTEMHTQWYHLGHGHRVYNPVLRRFHSPDRLSPFASGGLNAYAYCQGDPINYRDPTGGEIEIPDWMQGLTAPITIGVLNLLGGAAVVGSVLLSKAPVPRTIRAGAVASALGTLVALGGVITTIAKRGSGDAFMVATAGSLLNGTGGALRFSAVFKRAAALWRAGELGPTVRRNLKGFVPSFLKASRKQSVATPQTATMLLSGKVFDETMFRFPDVPQRKSSAAVGNVANRSTKTGSISPNLPATNLSIRELDSTNL